MNPRVKEVSVLAEYNLAIVFTNGQRGIYNCSSLLDFGVFKEFADYSYFKLARVSDGTVAWPHGQDICPDTLYLDSKKENCLTCA